MKMKFQNIITALVLALALLTSCEEKWIDPDLNIDPDAPNDVPMSMLIPSIQTNMAFDLAGNDAVMPVNLWMQYINGWNRQAQIYSYYRFTPADVNNLWNSIYSSPAMDLKVLMQKAEELESPHNLAVAQILKAYLFATATDLFGDIPYTEALNGSDNLTPVVDPQQGIYSSIDTLLNDAIDNLAEEDLVGITGDMMHKGSASAWLKTAYALKARFALNLSERNGNQAYTDALDALENAYTSNSDNLQFTFGTAQNEKAPIAQFVDERGDIVMGKYFMDLLVASNDPRLPEYAALSDADTYQGSAPAVVGTDSISFPGNYIADQDNPVTSYLMTYAECKFIEAEAKFFSDKAGALEAWQDGVLASVEQVLGDTVGTSAWFAANVFNKTTASLTMEDIMMQKYVANFGQIQPYNDFRRTGYPSGLLTPALATVPLPKRFPYSQEEIIYNSNVEALWQVSVFLDTPVWWDAN